MGSNPTLAAPRGRHRRAAHRLPDRRTVSLDRVVSGVCVPPPPKSDSSSSRPRPSGAGHHPPAAAVVGAGLIVLAAAHDWSLAVVIVGIALLIFGGVAGRGRALLLTARLRTVVVVGLRSILPMHPRATERSVPWSMIDKVSLRGPRLM